MVIRGSACGGMCGGQYHLHGPALIRLVPASVWLRSRSCIFIHSDDRVLFIVVQLVVVVRVDHAALMIAKNYGLSFPRDIPMRHSPTSP